MAPHPFSRFDPSEFVSQGEPSGGRFETLLALAKLRKIRIPENLHEFRVDLPVIDGDPERVEKQAVVYGVVVHEAVGSLGLFLNWVGGCLVV